MKNPIHSRNTSSHYQHEIVIPPIYRGIRLDAVLAKLLPQYSRNKLQQWIQQGRVYVNQKIVQNSKIKCHGDEKVDIYAIPERVITWEAKPLALSILYEDEAILVINKPVGLTVHPGSGNPSGTLANALLYHHPALANLPRAGIVHRLDKDTSGLLVIAKTLTAYTSLVTQLQKKSVCREYYAIVNGVMISGGTISAPIGRHPVQRQKMAVVLSGKPAVTHYRVIERFSAHTLIKVFLETGRTHQIRVHLAHKRYPLLGDKQYGARNILPKQASPALIQAIQCFHHQALHAKKLVFLHPVTHQTVSIEATLPDSFEALLNLLKTD